MAEERCPRCGGTGFVRHDVPVGHPDFGKAIACNCRTEERRSRRLRALDGISSLAALSHLTFETFIPEPSHLAGDRAFNLGRAFQICADYAAAPEGWLLLSGAYGCGKTHLAAAIANARMDRGEPVVFMVVPDLLDHLRASFSPQSEVSYDNLFEMVKSAPLLILDDLGAHSSTPWAQEKLFQLLNHRYVTGLATVITTNQRVDDMEPRLRSRLMDPKLVNHFPILAPDFRSGQNLGQAELSSLHLLKELTFAGFDQARSDLTNEARQNLRTVVKLCREYAADPYGWLVMSGVSGSGKTHLAAAIANEITQDAPGDAMFVVAPDLLDHLRATFSPQSNVTYDRRFDEIKKVRLLVLDDLGTESATAWAREKLFQLLNYRYNALLPTVITTTAKPDELEPRLRTRMFDTDRCHFCVLIAGPYRRGRQNGEGETKPVRKARPK